MSIIIKEIKELTSEINRMELKNDKFFEHRVKELNRRRDNLINHL